MNKLVVGTFLTLDGVMQAPGDPQEDTEGGFKHGGWQMPLSDEDAGKIIGESIAATDALLLGRVTYQIFAAFWPTAPADDPIAQKLNSVPNTLRSMQQSSPKQPSERSMGEGINLGTTWLMLPRT
jgi:dihydrofolate reductase